MSRIYDALTRTEDARGRSVLRALRDNIAPGPTTCAPDMRYPGAPPINDAYESFEQVNSLFRRAEWHISRKGNIGATGEAPALFEEFRRLRSRLFRIRNQQTLKRVLVTSAVPAEGKSFIACNLAQVIARQVKRRVLPIDADLHRSSLHTIFNTFREPGLTDHLQGAADEFSIVQSGSVDELYFIPAGGAVSDGAELLANGRFSKLLELLEPYFDWVIIDSPPVLPVSDTAVMASAVHGVLLVVRAGETPLDAIVRSRNELPSEVPTGVVLNRVDPREVGAMRYGNYDTEYLKAA